MSDQLPKQLLAATVAVCCLAGCGKSTAEKLVDESLSHMEAAERMLREADGKLEPLIDEVGQYRLKHRKDFQRLRKQGEAAFAKLSDDERERIAGHARTRGAAAMERINTLAQKFKQPKIALRVIHPLLIAATPKPPPPGRKSLLPKAPPLDMPGAATGAGRPQHHRHVH